MTLLMIYDLEFSNKTIDDTAPTSLMGPGLTLVEPHNRQGKESVPQATDFNGWRNLTDY